MQEQVSKVIYQVLINDEGQYSLWPEEKVIPSGWYSVGQYGDKKDCLEYIKNVWTDMRPKSLIDHMMNHTVNSEASIK